jgi:hypothetical protein
MAIKFYCALAACVSAFCWRARQPTSHCQKFGAQGVIQVRTQQGVAEKYTRSTIKLSVHNKIVGALNQIRLFKASVMKKPNFLVGPAAVVCFSIQATTSDPTQPN